MNELELIQKLKDKYQSHGEPFETYLSGLLYQKFNNYWDYIHLDTLLSIQNPKTENEDEETFIIYHQITELILKLIIHEIKQIISHSELDEKFIIHKFKRINSHLKYLIGSFEILKIGMDYEKFNQFRDTLAPASGLQSPQFRFIEIYATRLINLVDVTKKDKINQNSTFEEYFENIYWKEAGKNQHTGNISLSLQMFENKYLESFIHLAKKTKDNTLEDIILRFKNISQELKDEVLLFDNLFNLEWPMTHLKMASHFLKSNNESKKSTANTEWKKYLNPHFKSKTFFPKLK